MKKTFAYIAITAALAIAPLTYTGCAVMKSANRRANMPRTKIAAKIKTQLYKDPMVKGTQVEVTVLNGACQLSGFVDSQQVKIAPRNRAEHQRCYPGLQQPDCSDRPHERTAQVIGSFACIPHGVGDECFSASRPLLFYSSSYSSSSSSLISARRASTRKTAPKIR